MLQDQQLSIGPRWGLSQFYQVFRLLPHKTHMVSPRSILADDNPLRVFPVAES
jgi:hypothetical protein